MNNNKLKLLELFGGIGACSSALTRLGINYEIADYVEIDKYAVASYNAIHGTNFEPQDITMWDKDIDVDLIMHGSPCQDFSLAGKQAGGDKDSGTRSSLMYETIRIVEKLKPKYVIWENVKNLLSKKHRHNFDAYLEKMEQLGYTNYYQVLNAKDYGIPQNRERVFTVSILDGSNYEFPKPMPLNLKLKDMLEDEVDEKYFLSDAMMNCFMSDGTGNYPRKERFLQNINRKNQDIGNTITSRAGDRPTDNFVMCKTLRETLETNDIPDEVNMIDGYNRNIRDDEISGTITTRIDASNNTYLAIKNATKKGYLEAEEGDGVDISSRMQHHRGTVQKEMIQTLDSQGGNSKGVVIKKDTPNYIEWEEVRIRKLTPKECWRLMGFSDEAYEKAAQVNSNSQLYKQAGNSIVVNVLEAILTNLLIEKEKKTNEGLDGQ